MLIDRAKACRKVPEAGAKDGTKTFARASDNQQP
jgi:hypothetical protein